MTVDEPDLARRFRRHVASGGVLHRGDTVVVAVSGGVDSVVLLHLLCFVRGLSSVRLVVAHVDHAMRPGSAGDAAWVRGLARAFGVESCVRRLDPPPATEAEARRLRYAVLEEIRLEREASWVVTAHHADDQAETVLFRALRGTGLRGLRGIRERRRPGVWRPLLPFTRDEVMAYAGDVLLGWRDDPTNTAPYARNVLRHRILPAVEASVAPSARRALAALARSATENEAAWASLLPGLLEAVDARDRQGEWSVDRGALTSLHEGVRTRILRHLARRLGTVPGAAGTRSAVEFTSSGESGGRVPLGGGLELRRELDRLVLAHSAPPGAEVRVTIPEPGSGAARCVVGGEAYDVWWARKERSDPQAREAFGVTVLAFPLTVRSWSPGDRVRLAYGSKKLKKTFLEARIPAGRRHRIPVVVDARGRVLWVPGVVRSADAPPTDDDQVFYIGITHAEPDESD